MYFSGKEYIKSHKDYEPVIQDIEKKIAHFFKYYQDDSRFLSGWGHQYFCDEDGGKLIYRIESPAAHQCSVCGKVYKGFKYDGAYITNLRNEAVLTAVQSAFLYSIGRGKKYLGITKDIIRFYADNYDRFAIHAKYNLSDNLTADVGGAGKMMPQGLNEAIIMIRMINALELVKDSLSMEFLAELKTKLFDKAYELLLPQKMHIHNIPCWINSAIGVMGCFFQDEEWISEASENAFNIHEQIKNGVTESGFWYEGSIHYNFFALEGILNYMIFSALYNRPVAEASKASVLHMLNAAYHYAFNNDLFPNPSDGWPNVNLKTYSYVYYMGYKAFGAELLPYLQHIEKNPHPRGVLPLSEPYYHENRIPLERMLFVPELNHITVTEIEKRKSISFEKYNCAMLRNNHFNVFFKYGHQTKSHAHPDKMNIEVTIKDSVFTKDLSNAGYASKLCDSWHRRAQSHNTCLIDFTNMDIETSGKLLHFSDNRVCAQAQPYDGTIYTRELEISGSGMQDIFTVDCEKEHIIDYFYHFEPPINRNTLSLASSKDIAEYNYIFDVCEVKPVNGRLFLHNALADIEFFMEAQSKVYLMKTYNNPAATMRDTLCIRKKAKQTVVKNVIHIRDDCHE